MRLIFIILLTLALAAAAPGQKPTLRLVQWSDIHAGGRHFEPEVWDQALEEGLELRPDAILLTGDQGDNSRDRPTFGSRLQEFMAGLATDLADAPPLLLTLGNDDLAFNYQTAPEQLAQTDALMRATLKERYYLDGQGNGVSPDHVGGLTWISLNATFFSPANRYEKAAEQAEDTFRWLERQLASRGGHVVLLCHIPPSWDLWQQRPAWRSECLQRLQAILEGYPHPVTILCGHYHRNHVQAYHRRQGDVPVLVAGSLSNKFGYQPNWRTYEWTPGGALDYTVRYPGHPEWTHAWHVDPTRLEEFRLRLQNDDAAYLDYMQDIFCHQQNLPAAAAAPGIRQAVLDEFWVHP